MRAFREIVRRPWVRWVLLALVLPVPLFILLCNVLLWTGAVEAIVTRDEEPTQVRLEHGFAWMLWPTRVHVNDAHLAVDAHGYQLDVIAEDAVVDIRLLSLFDRRAHFQGIDASGVRAEYRVKIDPADAGHPKLAAFPPFDGTPPQEKSSEPKPLPAEGEAWGIDIDDAHAQLDSLWVDEFRFEPGGVVQGGMHWTDADDFTVTPTYVSSDNATLWLGEHEAIRTLAGGGRISIATFDSSDVKGKQILGYLSVRFRGDGEVIDPASLATWWPQVEGVVGGAAGPIEIDVAASNGVLTPGSRVHHHTERAEVRKASAPALTFAGDADLVLLVEPDGRPSATVRLMGAELVGPAGELARGESVYAYVVAAHGDMARPWRLQSTHVESGEIVLADLRRMSALARKGKWKITDGSGRVHATLDIGEDKIPTASFDVELDDAELAIGSTELGGRLYTRGRARRLTDGEIVVDEITARTGGLDLRTKHGKSENTWVRVRDTSVRYKEGELKIEGHASIEDARPAIIHLTRLDPVIDAVPFLQRIEPIKTHGKVVVRGDLVEVEIVEAEQLGLHVATVWRKRGPQWRLAVWVSGLTSFGFTATEDKKVRRPMVLVGSEWYAEQRRWARQLGRPRQG